MYKLLLIVPLLLASCSTVSLQGTAPCNGRIDITKPERIFFQQRDNGTLSGYIMKPICTIPFKKGDKIDEELTFCFLSGSELGIEVRHVHYTTVNKLHTLYNDLIGKADFVPNRTRKIDIDSRQFTIHTTDEATSHQYVSHIELMKHVSTPHIK